MYKYAIVPRDTIAYWENWWRFIDDVDGRVLLESRRTGDAARVDAEVLQGRLASGLHACQVFDTFDDARKAVTS